MPVREPSGSAGGTAAAPALATGPGPQGAGGAAGSESSGSPRIFWLTAGDVPAGVPLLPESGAEIGRIGAKALGLYRMARLGLPVPPALVLTVEVWRLYRSLGGDPERLWAALGDELDAALGSLGEAAGGLRLGDPQRPLVVSVRSGAAESMPGMLDTLLNVGLNDELVEGLATRLGDRRCALDCYRRFLQDFGTLVLGLRGGDVLLPERDLGRGAARLDRLERAERLEHVNLEARADDELDGLALRARCAAYRAELARHSERPLPTEAQAQVRAAIEAVLRSWDSPRAQEYRRLHHLSSELGTAVIVQAMVFGNLGPDSASGVAFTRDPRTGAVEQSEVSPGRSGRLLVGEFLPGAQGADIVSGSRTPRAISEMPQVLPGAYAQLAAAADQLEEHTRDLQEIEFTVERGRLYLLQTRTAKRSARAMVRIACDLGRCGRITQDEVLQRIEPLRLHELVQPRVVRPEPHDLVGDEFPLLARGLAASPGAASGRLAFSVADVQALRQRGEPAIFARTEASTEDILGIKLAAGVLTTRGGITSHAAVVARGLGRCAVVGAGSITIDLVRKELRTREHTLAEGEVVTVDGHRGEVLIGAAPLRAEHLAADPYITELLGHCNAVARVQVGAVVHSATELLLARDLDVRGAALCGRRTEEQRLKAHAAQWRAALLAPHDTAAAQGLQRALATELAGFLRAAQGPLALPLLTPATVQDALALATAPDPLSIWAHELRALDAALGQHAGAVQILVPAATPSDLRAVRELLQGLPSAAGASLAALVLAADVDVAALAAVADRLVFDLRALTAAVLALDADGHGGLDAAAERAVTSGACAYNPLRSLDEARVAPRLQQLIEAARALNETLPIDLYDCFELTWDERTLVAAHRAGLSSVICPLLRTPIARLHAARAKLSAKLSADLSGRSPPRAGAGTG
jgi:pyruvate,orthophosphate dikinase